MSKYGQKMKEFKRKQTQKKKSKENVEKDQNRSKKRKRKIIEENNRNCESLKKESTFEKNLIRHKV
jgi:hypothetical protein